MSFARRAAVTETPTLACVSLPQGGEVLHKNQQVWVNFPDSTTGDVITVALDLTFAAGTLAFRKNDETFAALTDLACGGTYRLAVSSYFKDTAVSIV